MVTKKRSRQLDRDIAGALAKRAPTKRPARDVVDLFTQLVSNAEAYGSENLYLARRDEGYTGDPKEFRYGEIYARRLPAYKYELIIDYIDEYNKRPHEKLGRKLTAAEADWMRSEASKIQDDEQRSLREAP